MWGWGCGCLWLLAVIAATIYAHRTKTVKLN